MIGYLAANDGTISGRSAETADGIMRSSGRNVGNLAFWFATRRLFDEDVLYIPWKTKGVALPQNVRALVIPAANFIGSHSNLAPITEVVRELDVPTLVVGLGAQSEREDALPVVNDSIRQFLDEVSKRTPYIGVRGDYSAKVCREFGFSNIKALGCPSVLMNPDRDLGRMIERKIAKLEPENIAIHAACRKGNVTNVEREFIRYVHLFSGSTYVIQRPPELVAVICREQLKPADATYVEQMASFLGMDGGIPELQQFLWRYGYVPTSIDSWRSFLRRFSCSINTRIHGTMVAIQSGLPALCICHDTRTRELAERMKLPALEVQAFIEGRYEIKRLFSATGFDGAAFDQNRRDIAQEYINLIEEIGLTPSAHLLAFATARAGGLARVA